MRGMANTSASMARKSERPRASIRALRRVALASACLSSPLRRATMAVMPTFSAKNRQRSTMRGWVGKPTEDKPSAPNSLPTMMVSTVPIRLMSTISMMEGSAMRITSPYAVFPFGSSPWRCSCFTRYSGASSRRSTLLSTLPRPPFVNVSQAEKFYHTFPRL